MTSRFEESMTKANAKVLAKFKDGDKITFTPKGGEAFETDAILGSIDGEIKDDDTGEMLIKTRRITIPLPEAMVEFADGIVTAKDEDWTVDNIIGISSGMVDLHCRWNAATSKHNKMHKKRIS